MDGVAFYRASVSEGLRGTLQPGNLSYCIMVKRGELQLEVHFPELLHFPLNAGDAVAISGLAPHAFFRGDAGRTRAPLETRPMTAEASDGPDIIVGVVRNEMLALVSMMIGPILVRAESDPDLSRQIWRAADMLEDEYRMGPQADQALVVRRIAELMLIAMSRQSMRMRPVANGEGSGETTRRRIAASLAALLEEPGKGWDLNSLARAAGMSRSRFAESFKSVTGQTPAHVVVRLRLADAAQRLMGSGISIDAAAEVAGYSSAAAFVRAFRREYGETPARWRRQTTAGGDGLYEYGGASNRIREDDA